MNAHLFEKEEGEHNRPDYLPQVPAMWIMNPANGHVYKWIACNTREDAHNQASLEKAHLVTITNEAEQGYGLNQFLGLDHTGLD